MKKSKIAESFKKYNKAKRFITSKQPDNMAIFDSIIADISAFKHEIQSTVKDGYTPIRNIDYFDGKDGKDGYIPIKGKDYFDGKDGYTPIKGKDYFDGENGKKGDQGSPDTPSQVRDKLESLKNDERLNYTAIKGLEELVLQNRTVIYRGGGGSGNSSSGSSIDAYTKSETNILLASKEPAITVGTNLQYWRGDKTWQTLNTSAVPESGNLYFTDERVDDRVNSLLVAGTGITLTYNDVSNTLTIDSAGGGGTPGGSDTQVQFNDSNSFGADSLFAFDKTEKYLGVGLATPLAAGHFRGHAIEVNDPTGAVGVITYDTGFYPNVGLEFTVRAYNFNIVGGTKVFSGGYSESTVVIDNGNGDTTYKITWSVDHDATVDGHRFFLKDPNFNGYNFDAYWDVLTDSFDDTGGGPEFFGTTITPTILYGPALIAEGSSYLSQSVGIGADASSPLSILHIKDPTAQLRVEDSNGTLASFVTNTGDTTYFAHNYDPINNSFADNTKGSAYIYMYSAGAGSYMAFGTSSSANVAPTNRIFIMNTGEVGINISPDAQLDVKSTTTTTKGLILRTKESHSTAVDFVQIINSSTGGVNWSINANGRMGIGCSVDNNYDISFGGGSARNFTVQRNPTNNTAGKSITFRAGDPGLSATDKAGGNVIFVPGFNVGTGRSAVLFHRETSPGVSGTDQGGEKEGIILPSDLPLTNNTATTVIGVNVGAGETFGGTILWSIHVGNGTDYQVLTGTSLFSIVNKAGTVTSTIIDLTVSLASSDITKTLTGTWSIANSGGASSIKVNANSSLSSITAGYPRIFFTFINNSARNVTSF